MLISDLLLRSAPNNSGNSKLIWIWLRGYKLDSVNRWRRRFLSIFTSYDLLYFFFLTMPLLLQKWIATWLESHFQYWNRNSHRKLSRVIILSAFGRPAQLSKLGRTGILFTEQPSSYIFYDIGCRCNAEFYEYCRSSMPTYVSKFRLIYDKLVFCRKQNLVPSNERERCCFQC